MSHGKNVDFSRKPIDLSTKDLGSRVCEFLSRIHPDKTAAHVSHDTGIPAASIAYWLATGGRPSAGHLLTLIGAYEAEFLISIAPSLGKWLDPVRREAQLTELQRKRDRINKEIQALRDETDDGNMGNAMLVDGIRISRSVASARLGVARLPEGGAIDRTGAETEAGEEP